MLHLYRDEYDKLKELLNTVMDKTNSPGIRRLAMEESNRIWKAVKLRNQGLANKGRT